MPRPMTEILWIPMASPRLEVFAAEHPSTSGWVAG
jgi:hypothetical protein